MIQEGLIGVPELKKRGWTETLIRDLLGNPDHLKKNPYYRSAAPMRLYALERVQTVEKSEDWTGTAVLREKRKQAASSALATKLSHLQEYLAKLVIQVPAKPMPELIEAACRHYNQRKEERMLNCRWRDDYDWTPATPQSDVAFLHRIIVNYLRHGLSRYERELACVYGKVGVQKAYIEINEKVYAAIADAYPELAAECQRQMHGKREP